MFPNYPHIRLQVSIEYAICYLFIYVSGVATPEMERSLMFVAWCIYMVYIPYMPWSSCFYLGVGIFSQLQIRKIVISSFKIGVREVIRDQINFYISLDMIT